MPRVVREFVESLVFLYPTELAANINEDSGGSGFLLGVEFQDPPEVAHVYVVTNKHVSKTCRVVRFSDGSVENLNRKKWVDSTDDDLAICALERPAWFSELPMIPASLILTESEATDDWTPRSLSVSYGDDVFMVSRLVSKYLTDGSVPAVRFGSLASTQPVAVESPHNESGYQVSFLVEMRSVRGHSGSPVIRHVSQFQLVAANRQSTYQQLGIRLLGIDWWHLPLDDPKGEPIATGAWSAGIACVVPAWKITGLLEENHLMDDRTTVERGWKDGTLVDAREQVGDVVAHPQSEVDRTADLMGKLLQVPKDEADDLHRSHE